jgi:hypothetical protein
MFCRYRLKGNSSSYTGPGARYRQRHRPGESVAAMALFNVAGQVKVRRGLCQKKGLQVQFLELRKNGNTSIRTLLNIYLRIFILLSIVSIDTVQRKVFKNSSAIGTKKT